MPSKKVGHRKRRTRQHVIADLGIHYLERVILEEGHTFQRLGSDYGYDLLMNTFDEHGYVEPGFVYFQCKATESIPDTGEDCLFDVDIRDYNLWRQEKAPVILTLFDADRRCAYWLSFQGYLRDLVRRPAKATRTIRVRIPKRQRLTRPAIATIRDLKRRAPEDIEAMP